MKKVFIIISVLIVFCSCEQDTDTLYPDAIPARFTPVMGEQASTAPNHTRVNNNKWSGNEIVGVAAFDATTETQLTTKYHKYTPDGMSGTHVQLIPTSDEFPICYPVNGDKITFTAFAPYITAPSGNTVTYNLATQSSVTVNNMEKLDFIYHKGTTSYSQDSPVASLSFSHKLSRVVINLTRSNNYPSSIAGAITRINGVPTSIAADLSNGNVTPSGSGNITPYRTATAADKVTFQAIVAPQGSTTSPSAAGRTLTFMVGGYEYTVVIDQVFEPGKSYTYDYVFDVTGVRLAGSKIVPWEGGTVAWDGDYYLRIDQNKITLSSASSTLNKLVMISNYTSNPVISFRSGEDPNSTAITWLSAPAISKSSSGSEYTYTLTYTSAANTAARSTPRVGYIHIAAGTLTAIVKVTQQGIVEPEANCYILPPGGSTIYIPVSRANKLVSNAITGSFSWELIWTDVSGNGTNGAPHANGAIASVTTSGTGNTGCLVVKSGSKEGNAVIAVTVGTGATRIKWSWHIWVTKFNPVANGKEYTNTNGVTNVFMDRNLGALKSNPFMDTSENLGLHYQWGRKDPFPASASLTADTEKTVYTPSGNTTVSSNIRSSQVSINTAVQNPFVFYTYSGDWCSDTSDGNTRWGSNPFIKSIHDPCPAGWRVPDRYAWAGHTADNFIYSATPTGRYHEQTGWYPCAGCRSGSSGALSNVTAGGYYWSAVPNTASTSYSVFFNGSEVTLMGASYGRTLGNSVRCIAEI